MEPAHPSKNEKNMYGEAKIIQDAQLLKFSQVPQFWRKGAI